MAVAGVAERPSPPGLVPSGAEGGIPVVGAVQVRGHSLAGSSRCWVGSGQEVRWARECPVESGKEQKSENLLLL